MSRQLFALKHTIMLLRANQTSLNNFPKKLLSLTMSNPSKEQIEKDEKILTSYATHPVFVDFLPNYDECTKDYKAALLKRCSRSLKK